MVGFCWSLACIVCGKPVCVDLSVGRVALLCEAFELSIVGACEGCVQFFGFGRGACLNHWPCFLG